MTQPKQSQREVPQECRDGVSHTCRGQYVGLEEFDYELWDVYFGPAKLGRFHERKIRIEDAFGKLRRITRMSN